MYRWTTFNTVTIVILALYCSQTVGRLSKRTGYHYKAHFEHASPAHEQKSSATHDLPESNKYDSSYFDYKQPSSSEAGSKGSSDKKPGYSIGSGLRSIAQGSANQAYTAVASQHAAAKQAAFIAKNTLAQAASQASATAQAALTGKQVILQELEQQAAEAHRSLSRELEQLKAAQIAAKLAQQTAEAAYHHVSVLTAAVNNAKTVAEQAEQTSNEVSNQLASQSAMVGQAKNRLEQVEEQLDQARVDYSATKEAALKAASSAAEAQVNASKAAAHATIGLHEGANHEPSGEGDEAYDENGETTAIGHAPDDIPGDGHH